MSNATLREALEALMARLDPYDFPDEQGAARVALAADDAARGTMPEFPPFPTWVEANDTKSLTAWAEQVRREAFVAGQASRAAAPQSVEPVAWAVWCEGEKAPRLLFIPKQAAVDAIARFSEAYATAKVLPLYLAPPTAPTDAEWQEEAMRLAREWCLSWGEWAHDNDPDCAKENAAEAALRAHIATRPQGWEWNFQSFDEWWEHHGKHNVSGRHITHKDAMRLAFEVARERPLPAPPTKTKENGA